MYKKGSAEALEVDNFALEEEFDSVVDVGIVRKAEDVVIHRPCLLLCRKVLVDTDDGIKHKNPRIP